MKLTWRKEHLDVILVPPSLCLMFGYHLFLLYRSQRCAELTVMGHENHCKKAWVERMLQINAKDRGIAVSVITSNVTAATSLSSVCLALSALIGALLGSSSKNIFTSSMIYGDTSNSVLSLKYISLLACMLVAFASFVQSARCFVHANFLVSMPNTDIPLSFIQDAVIHGSNFWALGMRTLHFAISFLLWVFGPIPMFASSITMTVLLHALDRTNKPLHQYQQKPSNNLFKKVGQEIITIDRVTEPQVRTQPGNENGT